MVVAPKKAKSNLVFTSCINVDAYEWSDEKNIN